MPAAGRRACACADRRTLRLCHPPDLVSLCLWLGRTSRLCPSRTTRSSASRPGTASWDSPGACLVPAWHLALGPGSKLGLCRTGPDLRLGLPDFRLAHQPGTPELLVLGPGCDLVRAAPGASCAWPGTLGRTPQLGRLRRTPPDSAGPLRGELVTRCAPPARSQPQLRTSSWHPPSWHPPSCVPHQLRRGEPR